MASIIGRLRMPLLKNVSIDFLGVDSYSFYPNKFPAIYGNSDFIVTGRYQTPGSAFINIQGIGEGGIELFPFNVYFSENDEGEEIYRNLWVKYAIDELETEILVYGEDDTNVDELIDLSLQEKMRCRYTAYVEDTTYAHLSDTIFNDDDPDVEVFETQCNENSVMTVYPNPAINDVYVKVTIEEKDSKKQNLLKLFDNSGKLLKIIDLSKYTAGTYQIHLADEIILKNSGYLIIVYEVDKQIIESNKIIIMK